MTTDQNKPPIWNPVYFWDVDKGKLDPEKSTRLIIVRVFERGTLQEIKAVSDFYGREKVIQMLKTISWMDPKTLNFVSVIYSVPKEQFKCYTKKPFRKGFWNY